MITMWYPIVILQCYIISLAGCTMTSTHLLISRAGPCYNTVNTLVSVSEFSLSTRIYDSLLSGEFNVSKDVENGWQVKATMQKCVDIRNIDSCDFFRSFYLMKNGCSDEKEETYYNLVFLSLYTHPKLQCPIKAGRYKLMDYPLVTEDNYLVVPESKISTSVFGYTFRLDGFTQNKNKGKPRQIFCFEALLQLMYTRNRDWLEETNFNETTWEGEE